MTVYLGTYTTIQTVTDDSTIGTQAQLEGLVLNTSRSLFNWGSIFAFPAFIAVDVKSAGQFFNYAGGLVFTAETSAVAVQLVDLSVLSNEGTIFAARNTAVELRSDQGATVINKGIIRAEGGNSVGVQVTLSNIVGSTIVNSGTITGHLAGIAVGSATATTITNTGTISGDLAAITSFFATPILLVNAAGGTIAGDVKGDQSLAAADVITNAGTINGDVLLGAGDDRYVASTGHVNGVIDGGAGLDLADYGSRTSKITATLNTSHLIHVKVGSATVEGFINFEGVKGGSAGDKLTGDSAGNWFLGGSGVDTISGSSGNDTIQGGSGKDVLDGGTGLDVADYSDKTVAVSATVSAKMAVRVGSSTEETVKNFEGIAGGSVADKLTGDSHANVLIGNGGNDTLIGGSGNDTLKGGLGSDSMDGGAGTDVADFSDLAGHLTIVLDASGNATVGNSIALSEGTDIIRGIEGLIGGTGWDTLTGNGAANTLVGNDGNDVLWGRGGADVMTGGKGVDAFVFSTTDNPGGANVDTITDFVSGTDRIYLDFDGNITAAGSPVSSGLFEQHASGHASVTSVLIYDQSNGQLWYDADGPGSATAVEVAQLGTSASHPASLVSTDFYFV